MVNPDKHAMETANKLAQRMGGRFVPNDPITMLLEEIPKLMERADMAENIVDRINARNQIDALLWENLYFIMDALRKSASLKVKAGQYIAVITQSEKEALERMRDATHHT